MMRISKQEHGPPHSAPLHPPPRCHCQQRERRGNNDEMRRLPSKRCMKNASSHTSLLHSHRSNALLINSYTSISNSFLHSVLQLKITPIMYTHPNRPTDRQTHSQIDVQTTRHPDKHKQTGRKKGKQTDTQTGRHPTRQKYKHKGRQTDNQTNILTGRIKTNRPRDRQDTQTERHSDKNYTDRQTPSQTDKEVNRHPDRQTLSLTVRGVQTNRQIPSQPIRHSDRLTERRPDSKHIISILFLDLHNNLN